MRFLILTQYFPPEIGGAQTRLFSFATELLRLGHEVEVVTALPNYPQGQFFPGYQNTFYRRELCDGLTIHRVWLYPAIGGGLKRMLNYASFTLTCLYGLFRAKKPDYLFVESPPLFLSFPAFLAKIVWGSPFIFNVADLWPDVIVEAGFMKDGFVIRVLQAIERWSYRRAAYVNTVTDWICEVLLRKKGVPREKLLFLPNGVDTERFQPRPPSAALLQELALQGKKIVLWAGTLGFAHGLEHVLHAAKLLEAQPDIHFLFVGDGSARASLLQLKNELHLHNVTFHDPVPLEKVSEYYSIALCGLASLINIPIYEGARPSKVFPVLASGLPLIFIGTGEGARMIQTANAGIVVSAAEPAAIAQAVNQLFRNPQLARELGRNGRQFVENNLQWSRLVAKWLESLHPARIESSPAASLEKLQN